MSNTAQNANQIRAALPAGGLFAGQQWRVATAPFALGAELAQDLESLGRVLVQFYRAVNLLYRHSVEGKQPPWIATWLDQGKPAELIALQRSPAFKSEIPRVIRPDLLLTENGVSVTELDSVPGGIGLTAWLGRTYSNLTDSADIPSPALTGTFSPFEGARGGVRGRASTPQPHSNQSSSAALSNLGSSVIGGADGMVQGFAGIFGEAKAVRIIVSEEAATYRPEMAWLAQQLGARFTVHDAQFNDFQEGDAVYRFFELFDVANVPGAARLFELAAAKQIRLTPPPKPILEEKLLFALLWNRNLREFWRRELGEGFLNRLLKLVPYTWFVDPTPLPPHAAIPELNLTDWQQLKTLSQRERDLILKVSGFSAQAWGARGVWLGSDLSGADWAAAVDHALRGFAQSPCVLQRYHKPRLVTTEWFDFDQQQPIAMPGRARLCPYYFVTGDGDAARPHLGGVLATLCPADKKIIHGMTDAVLAPCCV